MTEKQKILIDGLINAMPESDRKTYREIAEYVISLGYLPKKLGKGCEYLAFSKSKVGKTIIKILAGYNEVIDKNGVSMLSIKFFASPTYSEIFQKGVERVVITCSGCYGCGKCDGTHGYTYTYPDGRKLFRCGSELIRLAPISAENVPEIKDLLKKQDEFWMRNLS